jgi:hypothetical protein
MIVQETYELNGRQFVRTFSDEGRYVVGGVPEGEYAEANDPAEFHRSYTEGRVIEDDADVADYQNALSRLGVEV